jgi:nucleoside-diphosphate-sugar epimerase
MAQTYAQVVAGRESLSNTIIAGVTYLADNSKARRELGYAPRPLRQGWKKR